MRYRETRGNERPIGPDITKDRLGDLDPRQTRVLKLVYKNFGTETIVLASKKSFGGLSLYDVTETLKEFKKRGLVTEESKLSEEALKLLKNG